MAASAAAGSPSSIAAKISRCSSCAAASARPDLQAAEATLASADLPVLIIAAGATDVPQLPPGAFLDAQRTFAARLPSAELVIVPDARHYVMAERPAEVADHLQLWLQSR